MKQQSERIQAEERIGKIERNAIEQLKTNGFAEFESNLYDTAIMIQQVAELLFKEQVEASTLLSHAEFLAELPELVFKENKLFVHCRVTMSHPIKIKFDFSYQLKNGKISGKLELVTQVETKITLADTWLKNNAAKTLLKHFHVRERAQNTIANINEVLLNILSKKHGYPSCLKKVLLKINHSSLTIRLES